MSADEVLANLKVHYTQEGDKITTILSDESVAMLQRYFDERRSR